MSVMQHNGVGDISAYMDLTECDSPACGFEVVRFALVPDRKLIGVDVKFYDRSARAPDDPAHAVELSVALDAGQARALRDRLSAVLDAA